MQILFNVEEKAYDTRGNHNFRQIWVRTNLKSMCISVYGVKLWNSFQNKFKVCESEKGFKNMLKSEMIGTYKAS